MSTRFEIHLDLRAYAKGLKRMPERLQRAGMIEARKIAIGMTAMSQSLLPENWLLRQSLAPRAFRTNRGGIEVLYATISFAGGFRPVTPSGLNTPKRRRKKGDPLMSWRNPRKYGWFHDAGHSESRTRARHYIEAPKQRFAPIFESAVKTSWEAILGGM